MLVLVALLTGSAISRVGFVPRNVPDPALVETVGASHTFTHVVETGLSVSLNLYCSMHTASVPVSG